MCNRSLRCIAAVLVLSAFGYASDELTLYELLPPETHQFAITYDVTQTREGAQFFFNPIRQGSTASKERVGARVCVAVAIMPALPAMLHRVPGRGRHRL